MQEDRPALRPIARVDVRRACCDRVAGGLASAVYSLASRVHGMPQQVPTLQLE